MATTITATDVITNLTIVNAPFEYVVTVVTPVAEAIASIEEFIADTKEFDPANTAALVEAEAQLAQLQA
jgi:hypothetical protein